MVLCHYSLTPNTDTTFHHIFMWLFFAFLSDLWFFCGPILRSRIMLNSAESLRVRHRRDAWSDFCLLHTGFFFSWKEITEAGRWWENIQNCLSLFLKNFCRFFALCLDRFAPSPSPIIFYFIHYLRLDNTELFFKLFLLVSQSCPLLQFSLFS